MATNPTIQDLLYVGSLSEELHNVVFNGLNEMREKIIGLSIFFCNIYFSGLYLKYISFYEKLIIFFLKSRQY